MPTAFRWNLARREQLGALVPPGIAPVDPEYLREIRVACARCLAASGDSTLVFLGRSPETLFDYLSGALSGTHWADRSVLLNLSMRRRPDLTAYRPVPADYPAFLSQLREAGLNPKAVMAGGPPVAIIDLIHMGETFGNFLELLGGAAKLEWVAPAALRDRLRIVGLTLRKKNSPNTWRWQQQLAWAKAFSPRALKGVSLSPDFWDYLGGYQPKVTPPHPPWRWGAADAQRPPRDPEHLGALAAAVAIHHAARAPGERRAFAAELARQPAMRSEWLRRLALQVRTRPPG